MDVAPQMQEIAFLAQSVPLRALVRSSAVAIKGIACGKWGGEKHCLASMDSDLEAFSHNPTDDSVAALAFQLAALTNYLNQLFLSY